MQARAFCECGKCAAELKGISTTMECVVIVVRNRDNDYHDYYENRKWLSCKNIKSRSACIRNDLYNISLRFSTMSRCDILIIDVVILTIVDLLIRFDIHIICYLSRCNNLFTSSNTTQFFNDLIRFPDWSRVSWLRYFVNILISELHHRERERKRERGREKGRDTVSILPAYFSLSHFLTK